MDTSFDKEIVLDSWYEKNPEIEKEIESYLTTPVLKVNVPPCGYHYDDQTGYCYPNSKLLQHIIRMLGEVRYSDKRSLRDAREELERVFVEEGYEPIKTPGGLSGILTKLERKLGLSGRYKSSETRLIEERRKKNDRLREEGKNRQYHFSRPVKEVVETRKELTQAHKDLKSLKKKEQRLKAKASNRARKLKMAGNPLRAASIESKKEDIHPDNYKIPENREVVFRPNEGPQTDFLSADEDIVLYGGAAGGGKTYAMVVDPLRNAHKKEHRAVIIRKTMPELKEIIDISRELYPKYDQKAKYRESDHTWTFSSGAQIIFRFLERPADKFKFQGQQYTYIGFDELSQHDTSEGFDYLRSRLRRPDGVDIKPYVRATANPGSLWVYEMFIKDKEPNKTFILPGTENSKHPITCRFIPAKLEDNPYLDSDGMYRSVLESLDDTLKRQLLEGDWLAANDNMFSEFSIDTHVVEPFLVPKHWNRVAGLDYGYKDPSAGVWFAIDPEDNSIIVYDEFLERGLTGREFANAVRDKEEEELVIVDHPIDWSIYAKTGHSGPSIAESMLSVPGFRIRKADKNREAGWVQIHELLRPDPNTGMPKMRIFSTCKNLINQLMSVKVHPTKPGDIDQSRNSSGHWDLLDALRYGVMSRPKQQTFEDRLLSFKNKGTWDRYRGYFS